MIQPVKLFDSLGRTIKPILQGSQVTGLSRACASNPISECLESIDSTERRRRVADHLSSLPYPHYEQTYTLGMFICISTDGTLPDWFHALSPS